MLHSYSKIFHIGHAAVDDLFRPGVECIVEEKMDGSQISFGVDAETGELKIRSKGAIINLAKPEPLFGLAVSTIKEIQDKLTPGYVYRGEAICSPKHNTLCYNRIPYGGVVLFDIERGLCKFLDIYNKNLEAVRIGLECVPFFLETNHASELDLDTLLSRESYLGGPKIEGIVIKPLLYNLFSPDARVLMAKYVSEEFKEKHQKQWGIDNPKQGDILDGIAISFRTDAMFHKAVMRLKERGELTGELKDIGPLMKEFQRDLEQEWKQDIAEQLLKWGLPKIVRQASKGLPEWYKRQLASRVMGE